MEAEAPVSVTEWSIVSGRVDRLSPVDVSMPAGYELTVEHLGADGAPARDPGSSCELRVRVADAAGRFVHRRRVALQDHEAASLPFVVAVPEDAAFHHGDVTDPEHRNRGLATASLSAGLRELGSLGRSRAFALIARGSGAASARVYTKLGYEVVGRLQAVTTLQGRSWLVIGNQRFFRPEGQYRSEGVAVHSEPNPPLLAALRELHDAVLPRLRSKQFRVAIFGSGDAATQILELVPGLRGFVDAVVDSDPRRQGQIFDVTGHRIEPPERWADSGAWVLLYSSTPYQDEMQRMHEHIGPSGSLGLRVHPSVELIEVT